MAQPNDVRRDDKPHDRLTRICDSMTKTFDLHPEHRKGDKCIVFLDADNTGGIVLHGYEDDTEAMVNLLMHLKAMFAANEKQMDIMFLNDDGTTRV